MSRANDDVTDRTERDLEREPGRRTAVPLSPAGTVRAVFAPVPTGELDEDHARCRAIDLARPTPADNVAQLAWEDTLSRIYRADRDEADRELAAKMRGRGGR